ncbi:hypothetical protein [Pseudomonas synxantha]|uniref:hypothetical protein n=1 Tax=Pseudomonas synxantha TaxID=47883 RepID=UPI000519C1D7|nr:hypothetical protein [Pseudomonas synxantha]
MAILLTAEQMPYTKATNAFAIKNPEQTRNAFTITEKKVAADTLQLNDNNQITQLKAYLKDYDMTSISSDDLRKVGRTLFEHEMIDIYAFRMFIGGNLHTDAKGVPTETHVKFNAIALFNERLVEYSEFLEDNPATANEHTLRWRQGMVAANHAMGALVYFVNSSNTALSIDEKA